MSVSVGSLVLGSRDPMHIADRMLASRFRMPGGGRTLHWWGGSFWEWYADRWEMRDLTWMQDYCMREMPGYSCLNEDGVEVPLRPSIRLCEDVARGVQALTRLSITHMPHLMSPLQSAGPLDVGKCVGFQDVVVNLQDGGVFARDERWFDGVVVPCNYEEGAECPLWMQTVRQWSGGDDRWEKLAQRIMGYCLMPWRGLERGALLHGKIRGGKGTFSKVVKKLIGSGYFGTSLNDVVAGFGMSGMESARVLWVNEVNRLDGVQGDRFAGIWKNLVGRDPIVIRRMYTPQVPSVILNVFPIMSSNEIPELPNGGEGMSGKLLVLPFEHSFLGRENYELLPQLERELPGIAAWAVRGARELLAADNESKWPEPEGSGEVRRLYRLENNPLDAFLEARFVKDPGGFVRSDILAQQWREWLVSSGARLHLADNMLKVKLESESTWEVRRARNTHGERGMRGMVVRVDPQDDL